ncbi:MAG TPA: chemotaxis protein CheB [Pyrinomonadaceae bacterium]|nr:chemotaxis protein CheB [Pyrinomonadaceae bacterium]
MSEAEIVVIGTSSGGLKALQVLLAALPRDFPLPIAIVQHRGKATESGLCDFLNQASNLPVKEPDDKELVTPGNVYLAPKDYHLLIESRSFALSTEPPVTYARPSIDVLFESAADEYESGTIGVILTGANQDGARGLQTIKARGGTTVVEDPLTAFCGEMPRAAIAQVTPDWILPLPEIANCLEKLSRESALQYGV